MHKAVFILFALIAFGAAVPLLERPAQSAVQTPTPSATLLPLSSPLAISRTALQAAAYTNFTRLLGGTPNTKLIEPVLQFKSRITKKNFGIFITPDTSPVENDRFAGYHTGVDAEFTDTGADIPVYAISSGTIVVRTRANGYGGVIVIRHVINGTPVFALYGHLDPASLPASDIHEVQAGQQIAILGDDHSEETDGVRKHLHFSIYTGEKIDYRGYVQTEEELQMWLNPLDLF
jgi:murein DD-endopeptidase MepM/ murein hydrolase activator NlpD